MSTMSTGMNSLSAVWYTELKGSSFLASLSDRGAGILVKILSLVFGVLSYLCVFLVPYMGGLIAMNMTFLSICIGSLFGLFILGICFSCSNSWGAWSGLLGSVGIMLWVTVGGFLASQSGLQVSQLPLPSSVELCHSNSTSAHDLIPQPWAGNEREAAMGIYRISYLWYNALAMVSCITIGLMVSLLTNACFRNSKMTTLPITNRRLSIKDEVLNKEQKIDLLHNKI